MDLSAALVTFRKSLLCLINITKAVVAPFADLPTFRATPRAPSRFSSSRALLLPRLLSMTAGCLAIDSHAPVKGLRGELVELDSVWLRGVSFAFIVTFFCCVFDYC